MTDTNKAQQHLDRAMEDTNAWSLRNILGGGVCDFCARPHVVEPATFVAREVKESITIIDPKTNEVGHREHVFDPYWSACPACTVEVERDRDGERLAEWVVANCDESVRSSDPAQQFVDLAALYTQLYEGGLRRLKDADRKQFWKDEYSDKLWTASCNAFLELLPDAYGRAEFLEVRDEIILRVQEVAEPMMPRKAAADIVDLGFQQYQHYYAEAQHDRHLHERWRDVLQALGAFYLELFNDGEKIETDDGVDVAMETTPERVAEADRLLRALDAIPEPRSEKNQFEIPPAVAEMLGHLRGYRDAGMPDLVAFEEARRINARAARIAAHRKPDVVHEGTKCANCGKRPARVDHLCKRCAKEAGILPHGKIGEG